MIPGSLGLTGKSCLAGLIVSSFRALGVAVQRGSHQPHVALGHWHCGDSELRCTVGVK